MSHCNGDRGSFICLLDLISRSLYGRFLSSIRTSQTLLLPLPWRFIWNSPGSVCSSALPTFLGCLLCSPSACSSFPPLQLLNWLTPTDWLTLQIPSGLKLEILISKAHTISLISAALSVYISDNALTLSSQNLDFSSLIVHSLHFSLPSFAQLSPS